MTFQKIKIVTDSVCDIPAELLARYNIAVIPCYVNYNGQSYADDGRQLNRDEFYRMLPTLNPYPTTSAPAPGLAAEILGAALEGCDHLVGIHVPSALSATFANIRLGASQLPQDRITLVDSQMLTMAQGMQVLLAAEVAERTGSVAAVLETLEQVRRHQRLYAVLYSLGALRRSGRVNPLIGSIGTLLQIKPIVEVRSSQVEPVSRVRTFSKALDALYDLVVAQAPFDRLAVLHIQNLEGAQTFLERLGDLAPPDTLIVEVGPTLGTHIGPGSIGAATLNRQWKDKVTYAIGT